MKTHYFLAGILTILILSTFTLSHYKGTSISAEEAEQIALIQAEKDGYKDVKLWTRFNTHTRSGYHFSVTKNRDIPVWKVHIDAANNPPNKNVYAALWD